MHISTDSAITGGAGLENNCKVIQTRFNGHFLMAAVPWTHARFGNRVGSSQRGAMGARRAHRYLQRHPHHLNVHAGPSPALEKLIEAFY